MKGEKISARVSSLSLVRYWTNDYSVPTEYGHRQVWVKGYVHEVVIACGSEVITRHQRSYERETLVFDPLHYLALLEQKTRALAQAAPLAGWQLPECFAELRRLLEARLKKHGSREYVQVLRLMENFAVEEVTHAVEQALRLGTISFDAVAPSAAVPHRTQADTPQLLLEHHLKELRLPTILREYDKVARQCAVEQVDYARYLLRMTELELLDRERRATERRIRQAKFPVVKTMDSFDFLAMPSLNKTMVLELARCEFLARRENVLLLGNSGTGKTGGPSDRSSSLGWKTHIALALGLAACQRGHRVRFTTASALVSELIEARDEKKLLRFQKQIASYELLIVDELGFVPLSKTGAELLFEMLSQRYERGSTMVTSNLPFQEWAEVLGSERLTGALLDPLTHHVHILEMNRDRYRLKQSRRKHGSQTGV
jgi:DNA replication protein DnaC